MKHNLTCAGAVSLCMIAGMATATTFQPGLKGEFWDQNNVFERQFIGEIESFVGDAANTPDATFIATELNYPRGGVALNPTVVPLDTFLADDFDSFALTDPTAILADFTPGNDFIMRLTGIIGLTGGTHTFRARADDGMLLTVGGTEIFRTRVNSADVTSYSTLLEQDLTVSQGLYDFELIYFDNTAANFGLFVEVDGQTVDSSFTATTVPPAVPLPASGVLLMASVGAIGVARRRRVS